MTDLQKNQILTLREQGCTYAEISRKVSISLNTVKSFCYRKNGNDKSRAQCKNCGKTIIIRDKCKPRQFCCDTCRIAYWKRTKKPKRTIYHLICETCGREFECDGNKRHKMLNSKLITEKEYAKIDTITADTCGLSSCSIYRENSLINHEIRGNISHNTIGR